jgi:transposase
MKLHANAALSLNRRRLLVRRVVDQGWSLTKAAAAAEVSGPTARKWVARYLAEGEAGLLDRPSAARRVHNRTPEDRVGTICALRRLRFTGAEIAEVLGMPATTVSGILTRTGLGRLGRIGLEPARRYERSRPGELVHVDVKKLGRITRGAGHRVTGRKHYTTRLTDRAGVRRKTVGWEFVHVCVDDATRLAYAEVLGDERRPRRPPSCAERCAFSRATGSRSSACSPTMARPTSRPSTRSLAGCSAFATCAPGPADHRPTASPSASSARCSAAGPTGRSIAARRSAQPPLTAGFGATTIADHTAPSAASPRQLAYAS